MTTIDNRGYLKRKTGKNTSRNWYIVKSNNSGCGQIPLGSLTLPKDMIGKKFRLKIEFIEENKNEERKINNFLNKILEDK